MGSETLIRQLCLALLEGSVKGLLLLLAAGAAASLLRRWSAEARHAVWVAALAGLLLLPVLAHFVRPIPVPAPRLLAAHHSLKSAPAVPTVPAAPTLPAASLDHASLAPPRYFAGASIAPAAAAPASRPFGLPDPWLILGGAWLTGVLFSALRLLLALRTVRGVAARCDVVEAGPLRDLSGELAQRAGVRGPVRLRVGRQGTRPFSPLTYGVLRPEILLPAGAERWSEERLRGVLLHELAHVRRRDWLQQLLARGVRAVYWFHPAVWWAEARLRMEAEQACDEQVLRTGVKPSDYAAMLLEMTRMLRDEKEVSLGAAVTPGGPRGERRLAQRLESILRAPASRRSGALLLPALAAVGVLLAPLAALRVSAQTEKGADVVEVRPARPGVVGGYLDNRPGADTPAARPDQKRRSDDRRADDRRADERRSESRRPDMRDAREELLRAREELRRAQAEVARARAEAAQARAEADHVRAEMRAAGDALRRGAADLAPGDPDRRKMMARDRELLEQHRRAMEQQRQALEQQRAVELDQLRALERDLDERLKHLDIDRKLHDTELDQMQRRYENGAGSMEDLVRARSADVKARIEQKAVAERLARLKSNDLAKPGRRVREDDVLRSQADLDVRRANLETLEEALNRAQQRVEAGVAPKLELDRLLAEVEHAKASLAAAAAQLQEAQKRLAEEMDRRRKSESGR